jgi:iron-sulfur cluster assembly accessory protein
MSKRHLINITKNAWTKIHSILELPNTKGMLFTAESGGCNGFNYKLNLINDDDYNKILKNKLAVNILKDNNSHVIIDPLSEMFLIGTEIDYIDEDYAKGIFEKKFVFNPDKKLVSACGCGISFNPKN